MGQRPFAARLDGQFEDCVELGGRNHELTPKCLVARHERTLTGKALLQLAEDLLEVRIRVRGRDGVVERFRLLVERHPLAFEYPDARGERGELALEILTA